MKQGHFDIAVNNDLTWKVNGKRASKHLTASELQNTLAAFFGIIPLSK
jgi:hypothetical protein